jgi:hypothetical protein
MANIVQIDGKKITTPSDADDFASLWLDPSLGDGITTQTFHSIAVGKPKDFFRVHPDPDFRRRTEIYTHKAEGMIDEQHYIVAPSMRGLIDEAQPCTLVACVYRDGSPRIWPIKMPKDGARDNEAWQSARAAAKNGLEKWTKIVWVRRAYKTREALPGYAPDPDWTKLPSWEDLITLGFGVNGIIRDKTHPIYRELFGDGSKLAGDDGGI